MKIISSFYGIKIYMDKEVDYISPVFHAGYENHSASFTINELRMYKGELPPKVIPLVLEWGFYHREELLQNYKALAECAALNKIAPLQ